MKDPFVSGYICAVASLVYSHDPSTEVAELLGSIGPVHKRDIDQVDWDRLKEAGWTKGLMVTAKRKSKYNYRKAPNE